MNDAISSLAWRLQPEATQTRKRPVIKRPTGLTLRNTQYTITQCLCAEIFFLFIYLFFFFYIKAIQDDASWFFIAHREHWADHIFGQEVGDYIESESIGKFLIHGLDALKYTAPQDENNLTCFLYLAFRGIVLYIVITLFHHSFNLYFINPRGEIQWFTVFICSRHRPVIHTHAGAIQMHREVWEQGHCAVNNSCTQQLYTAKIIDC